MNQTKKIAFEDEKMVEQLFKAYYSPLCKLIFRLTNDKESAKDIAQDAFLKICNIRDKIDQGLSIKSLLYKIAINNAYNLIERNKKSVPFEIVDINSLSLTSNTTEDQLNVQELSKKINAALELLPPRCKAVFILSRYENMKYSEIAEALEIAPKTVENQMSKALDILRINLKEYLTIAWMYILFEKYL